MMYEIVKLKLLKLSIYVLKIILDFFSDIILVIEINLKMFRQRVNYGIMLESQTIKSIMKKKIASILILNFNNVTILLMSNSTNYNRAHVK